MIIDFFVPGIPKPGGSKTPFRTKYGKIVMVDACKKSPDWKMAVVNACQKVFDGVLFMGPLRVDFVFYMPRPKGHFKTGRNAGGLKGTAPLHPDVRPDRTKLLRCTEDALKGVLWKDDSQVVAGRVEKRYGDPPGARIVVTRL